MHTRAFLWENGRMHELLPLPGDIESGATGINDCGQIVGWSSSNPRKHRFLEVAAEERGSALAATEA